MAPLAFTVPAVLALAVAPGPPRADAAPHERTARSAPADARHDADPGPLAPGLALYSLASLQDAPPPPALSPFRASTFITLRPQYWLPSLEGHMSLDDGMGFSTSLDFEDDLGVDDTDDDFSWEVGVLLGPTFLRASGYSFASSALETANQTITFGGVTVMVGDLFDASIDVTDIKLQAGWALLNLEDHGITLAVSAGVDLFQIEATIRDASTLLEDSIDEDLPLPIIGVHLALPIDRFLITADAAGLSFEVEDIDFSYIDASVSVTWMPVDHVGVFGGYRIIDFDLDSSDFDLDATLSGPFFGFEVRF